MTPFVHSNTAQVEMNVTWSHREIIPITPIATNDRQETKRGALLVVGNRASVASGGDSCMALPALMLLNFSGSEPGTGSRSYVVTRERERNSEEIRVSQNQMAQTMYIVRNESTDVPPW